MIDPNCRVVVAIPTLLGGPRLHACLTALDRQTWRDFEVIVIDNSRGESRAEIPPSGNFRFRLRVLRPEANLGYGSAINLAVAHSASPLVAALNDDTEPSPEWIGELVCEIDSDWRVGMCASQIVLMWSGAMDSAGMNICLDGSSKQRGERMSPDAFSTSGDVLFPSGCAALYRRQMLEEIGSFDGDFFLYCEDTDLGLRAAWAGWRCRYAAAARVWHHYSASAGPSSQLKATCVERNRLRVAIKNFPPVLLLLLPVISAARYFWQWLQLLDGRGAAVRFVRTDATLRTALFIVAKAHFDALREMPVLLRKRTSIRKTRRIGSRAFIKLILQHRITVRDLARA